MTRRSYHRFTREEEYQYVKVGTIRNNNAKEMGRTAAHSFDGNPLRANIVGAAGELAVALYVGEQWKGLTESKTPGGPDVGNDIQVRTSERNRARSGRPLDLIVYPGDPTDHRYVRCTFMDGAVILEGWATGTQVKDKKYWRDPSNGDKIRCAAFFFPINKLMPMDTFNGI